MNAISWNNIKGKWIPQNVGRIRRVSSCGGGVINRPGLSGEVAGQLLRVGHSTQKAVSLSCAERFVIREKEGLVSYNRPSEGVSILVLPKGGLLRVEEIARIQLVITQELVGAPVKLIGARFDSGVDHRYAASVFGGK